MKLKIKGRNLLSIFLSFTSLVHSNSLQTKPKIKTTLKSNPSKLK